jgi:hypothetical protein
MGANGRSCISRLRKNSAHTGNTDELSQNDADATIAQDCSKWPDFSPAHPWRAARLPSTSSGPRMDLGERISPASVSDI